MEIKKCDGAKLGTREQIDKLNNVLKCAKDEKWTIIKVLQSVQKIYGYLPEVVIKEISKTLSKPVAELYSVITFYAEFSLTPKGKYPISVCLGTACYVNGAGQIFDKICMMLNIKEGETTPDGRFSIDQTRCIGCCGMAPVLTIGSDVYGNVKLGEVENILKTYMEKK